MSDDKADFDINGDVGNIANNVSTDGGNITQVNNKVNYDHDPFPVSDPSGLNSRVNFYKILLGILPLEVETFEKIGAGILIVGFALIAGLMYSIRAGLDFVTDALFRTTGGTFLVVIFIGAMILSGLYFGTKQESTCRDCGTPFGYRNVKSTEVDRVPRPDQEDIRRVERKLQCGECGHENTRFWTNG